jgi:hypothetical protein
MKEETQRVAKEALSGASKGALIGAAASIASGLAVVAIPVTTLFGFVTIGTVATVAAPVVTAGAVTGALIYGIAAAVSRYRKNKKINEHFKNLGGDG